jgi:hypothetical protein
MKFHKDGTLPQNRETFVFGSNLGGVHGSGAARVAREQFGAEYFVGAGPSGNSYAIPTKNETIEHALPLKTIDRYVQQFIRHARSYEGHVEFFVTAIGCGLAGYTFTQIAPMFKDAPDNCSFPDTWKPYLSH